MAFAHKKLVIRSNVLWLGPSEDSIEFSHRQLSVALCDSVAVQARLPFATALIVNVCESNRGDLAATLRLVAKAAIHHGLVVHVIADSDATQLHVGQVLKTLSLTDLVYASTKPALHLIAENVARHDPGPSFNAALTLRGHAVSEEAAL